MQYLLLAQTGPFKTAFCPTVWMSSQLLFVLHVQPDIFLCDYFHILEVWKNVHSLIFNWAFLSWSHFVVCLGFWPCASQEKFYKYVHTSFTLESRTTLLFLNVCQIWNSVQVSFFYKANRFLYLLHIEGGWFLLISPKYEPRQMEVITTL